jgi:stage II sporulation protein D
MSAIAAAMLLALAGVGPAVEVEILGGLRPTALSVEGGGVRHSVALARGELRVDGRAVDGRAAGSLALPPGRWRVSTPGRTASTWRAALRVEAAGEVLRAVASMDLEEYAALAVASETLPGTPPPALEAQAVVARAYAISARGRHAGGRVCDLAHCQFLRPGSVPRDHLLAARRAARATRGLVLRLPSGEVAGAVFHASCGGHTADPREAFGGEGTGAAAVPDPGCPASPWRARVPSGPLAATLRQALGAGGARVRASLEEGDLAVVAGKGGWVAQVAARDGSFRVSGDAFARLADAVVGRGRVRSSRFRLDPGSPGRIVLSGAGHGHGVGLCQAGAARRARAGAGAREILAWYFPGASVEPLGLEAVSGPGPAWVPARTGAAGPPAGRR